MIHIGIDTGTHTGVAAFGNGKLVHVSSGTIWQAVDLIRGWNDMHEITLHIEDARLAKFWKAGDNARAQGAGSVKRDASIWEQFAKHYGIAYVLHRPKLGAKIDHATFKRITGWQGRTNSHARDAAMMVFGLR